MTTEQDTDILIAMIGSKKPIGAYRISQKTGISQPQVKYRLQKLIDCEIVRCREIDGNNQYEPHPVLNSTAAINKMTEHIMGMSDIVDKCELSSPKCVKSIISFIVNRADIQ